MHQNLQQNLSGNVFIRHTIENEINSSNSMKSSPNKTEIIHKSANTCCHIIKGHQLSQKGDVTIVNIKIKPNCVMMMMMTENCEALT